MTSPGQPITGAVVSSVVKVASRVMALLLESVRVKVTVSVPVAPQSSLKPVLLVVMVTEPQLSIPEKVLFNQLLNSVVFPEPSQATVKSLWWCYPGWIFGIIYCYIKTAGCCVFQLHQLPQMY